MPLASIAAFQDLLRHPGWLDAMVTLSARRQEYVRLLETEASTIEEVKALQAAISEIRFIEALPQWIVDNYSQLSEMEDNDE